jgi:lipoyl(octanoyl) transferase
VADRRLYVAQLGTVPYGEALDLQRQVAQQVITGSIDGDVLLLLEHPPVVTLGRSTKAGNLSASPDLLLARGVELFEVERGGDVTFHGPGQLVGYPIVDLKAQPHKRDLHWYLRQVEEALIRALGRVGIVGMRNAGYTGVWVGDGGPRDQRMPSDAINGLNELADGSTATTASTAVRPQRKIASIGVHARDWVTWHGFAINVTTDLSYFELIVPCGIQGVQMTTVARELGATASVSVPNFADTVVTAWSEVFAVAPEPHVPHYLVGATTPARQPAE